MYSVLLKQLKTYPHHPHLSIHLPEKLCQVRCVQQLISMVICNKEETNIRGTACRRLFTISHAVGLREGSTFFPALHILINIHPSRAQQICPIMSKSKDYIMGFILGIHRPGEDKKWEEGAFTLWKKHFSSCQVHTERFSSASLHGREMSSTASSTWLSLRAHTGLPFTGVKTEDS